MNFRIRQANDDDAGSIAELYINATGLMARLCPDGFGQVLKSSLNLEKERENFSQAIGDAETALFVAEFEGKVGGFIMGVIENYSDDFLEAPFVTVQYICVDEALRRQGAGAELMRVMEDWTASKGISNMDLMVWANNEPAKALFQKSGYVPLELRMAKKVGER